jgi:magnesium-dependent phosphatase-1
VYLLVLSTQHSAPDTQYLMVKLIAFDGDDTLWTPLSGVCLSDRTPTDALGWPHFTYKQSAGDPLIVERDDGARFALRPEARAVFEELKKRKILIGLVSYNHEGNVRRILEAFGLLDLVDYVVAEWHSNKDKMLGKMLLAARQDGHDIDACDMLLVDDDPYHIYAQQCKRIGANLVCFGSEIHNLRELLPITSPSPAPR